MTFLKLKKSSPPLVGEISQLTAEAGVDPKSRVNFHIGNPVQDEALNRLYNAILSGDDFSGLTAGDFDEKVFFQSLDDADIQSYFRLLFETSRKSVSYAPAGGFSPKNPGTLTRKLAVFFNDSPKTPVRYNFSKNNTAPEFAMASGGRWQALKILLQMFFEQAETPRKTLLVVGAPEVPEVHERYPGEVLFFDTEGSSQIQKLESFFASEGSKSVGFMVLHKKFEESHRRRLSRLLLEKRIFLIEVNQTASSESLSAVRGTKTRMVRILSPEIIHPELKYSSLAFLLGPAEIIEAFNRRHFKKMGTPPASEIKLLDFFLNEDGTFDLSRRGQNKRRFDIPSPADDFSEYENFAVAGRFPGVLRGAAETVEEIAADVQQMVGHFSKASEILGVGLEKTVSFFRGKQLNRALPDPFSGKQQAEILLQFFTNLNDSEWQKTLTRSFLSVFQNLHPEYDPAHLVPVSGSARTGLSTMAEAWRIQDVIIPDFSWTVGDAFPHVTAVPLNEDLQINPDRFISVLEQKLAADSDWRNTGIVIWNNPQNATGKIWDEQDVEKILIYCLQRGIRVIDDLSYSDVVIESPEIRAEKVPVRSLKKIAVTALGKGKLRESHLRNLITLQSISKTDCKAGARLAVCEIPDPASRQKFQARLSHIRPNLMAILMSTLFYRRGQEKVSFFWRMRDWILWQRSCAIQEAFEALPDEINPYKIRFLPPQGAMYPQLAVQKMPAVVQIEKLAFQLAHQGIGLIPMTNFSRTVEGFNLANRTFRLTLGGELEIKEIPLKIRRLMEELTEQIRKQAENYYYHRLPRTDLLKDAVRTFSTQKPSDIFRQKTVQLYETVQKLAEKRFYQTLPRRTNDELKQANVLDDFLSYFLPRRWQFLENKMQDLLILKEAVRLKQKHPVFRETLFRKFLQELHGEDLESRRDEFTKRLFDRTVHPTQMYSIRVEQLFIQMAKNSVLPEIYESVPVSKLFRELVYEFVGENVPISSQMEAEEVVCDFEALHLAENYGEIFTGESEHIALSFWGDWDGSTRPSGQGHTLISGPLIANIRALALQIKLFQNEQLLTQDEERALQAIGSIEKQIENFRKILQKITQLTSRLEEKYRKTIPLEYAIGRLKRFLRKLRLLRDPLKTLWKHNDRNERRMQQYRRQRSSEMRRLFEINQTLIRIAKDVTLRNREKLQSEKWLFFMSFYKNYLKRFYLTPRIHQKIILDKDQFTVNTTVYNLVELNVLGSLYGYEGLVLAIQVSMAGNPHAILTLYRKLCEEKERVLHKNPELNLPDIRIVPLFEELEAIQKIPEFLDEIWEYAEKSRKLRQRPQDRFCEIMGEFFIAGSDLSQQVGQLKAYSLYQDARDLLNRWMWKKDLLGKIRIKFGSGESPQRQGGYYDPTGGSPVFRDEVFANEAFQSKMDALELRSFRRARSPLMGILSHSDFRTFQSNVMERLRNLPAGELADVFHNIRTKQVDYWNRVFVKASQLPESDPAVWQKLSSVVRREDDEIFVEFLDYVKSNFTQIVYGRPEDMTGIHVVSYFLSRTLLPLRDRPTVRPSREPVLDRSREILERLSNTLPLATHGTMLRAIGHNKAQTFLLGVNQFTTGLFLSLYQFLEMEGAKRTEQFRLHILPHLPVRDILNTLRLYHDPDLIFLKRIEDAFPPGNSALKALKEEQSILKDFIPLFQEELLRKSGVLTKGQIPCRKKIDELLPYLRPDLAVLLQRDIFNWEADAAFPANRLSEKWRRAFQEEFDKRRIIGESRKKMWEMLEKPISEQVRSFIELAKAVKSLFTREAAFQLRGSGVSRGRVTRLATQINDMLRNIVDDSMRQFLLTAVQFLLYLPETMKDIPEEVLLALRDMEKILKLDEEALTQEQQRILLSYFLKMARTSGNSG